jgi:membrane-associated phospholipid phosphatase
LLIVAAACAMAVAALTALVMSFPYIGLDDAVLRAIQSVDLGPLTAPFAFFRWAGGPGGLYMTAATILLVLLFNRRAWLLAVTAIVGGVWYEALIALAHRPRPTAEQVLRITEHPGATSFPSGHVIFITINLAVLMLCVGYRYLPARGRAIGWAVVAAIALLVAISRVYVGAHWPTDVLASLLVATGWLCLVVSLRRISDPALGKN